MAVNPIYRPIQVNATAARTWTGLQTFNQGKIRFGDTSDDHYYTLGVSELAADRTITLPLLTDNDTFVFNNFAATLANKTLTAPVINGTVTTTGLTLPAFTGGGDIDMGNNAINNIGAAGFDFTSAGLLLTGSSVGLSARDITNSQVSYVGEGNGGSVADGESFTFSIPGPMLFMVYNSNNDQIGLFLYNRAGGAVIELSDPSNTFEVSDTCAAFCVFEASAGVIEVKNNIGSTKILMVLALGKITSATVPA